MGQTTYIFHMKSGVFEIKAWSQSEAREMFRQLHPKAKIIKIEIEPSY